MEVFARVVGSVDPAAAELSRSAAGGLRDVEATPSNAVAAMLGLADAHELRHRAEALCRQWLCSSAEEDDLGGLLLADIQVVFERCALVFDHGILSYPFVETRLGLYIADPAGCTFRGDCGRSATTASSPCWTARQTTITMAITYLTHPPIPV